MNPIPNVMSQDPGSLTQQEPKLLRGSYERIFTAVIQLVCGFITMVCGVVLVILKTSKYDYFGYWIEVLENTAFGIWGGLAFITTAIPYFFGRDKKPMVGIYFGFSLASAVIAAVGLGLSVTAVKRMVSSKTFFFLCNDVDSKIGYKNPCCFQRYDNCLQPYNSYNEFSWYSYQQTTEYPPLDYNSLECELQRQLVRDFMDECHQEIERSYVPHLVFHGILIAVVSVELFASVYGAWAALLALCSCKWCVTGPSLPYSSCSFNQPMVNGSLSNSTVPPPPYSSCSPNQFMVNGSSSNTTVPPPVSVQPPQPTMIDTIQVPQMFSQPQMSSQQPLDHSHNNLYEVRNV